MGDDPFEGERKHCWVLIKEGKRDVKKDIFIEPGTGRRYNLDCKYYLSVDCVFNNQNYWINMQPDLPCSDVKFNEMDQLDQWEYVMLDTVKFDDEFAGVDEDEEGLGGSPLKMGGGDDDDELKDIAQVLDMPAPWPPKIILDYDAYMMGTPLGEGCTFFSKCQFENFAEYSQVDGLVKKITIFHDYRRRYIKEIRYLYQHRVDKLRVKRRFP